MIGTGSSDAGSKASELDDVGKFRVALAFKRFVSSMN